jgi:hypothetical protein
LGRMFRRATELGVLRQLHPRHPIPSISLYPDDVILFCHTLLEEVEAVKELLKLFGRASGLCSSSVLPWRWNLPLQGWPAPSSTCP